MTVLDTPRPSGAIPDGHAKDRVLVLADQVVEVVHTYFEWAHLTLHSLRLPTRYDCAGCKQRQESAMIAIGPDMVLCPGCFAANLVQR